MLMGLSLRLRILLIFAGLAGVALALMATALWVASRGLAARGIETGAMLDALMQGGLLAGLGLIAVLTAVWYLFDLNVAKPIESLAGGLRTGRAPDAEQARYLADLGPAARDAAVARAQSAEALADAIREHAAELAREKSTLESILSDFGAGAVMTDPQGRVVFYNASAARLLPGLALDRPLDRHLGRGALDAAAARIAAGAEATDLRVLTTEGQQLSGRMRRIDDGTLLILRDRAMERPAPRATLESLRRHAATLVPMLDALDGPIPPALAQAIRSEGHGLAAATRALSDTMASDAPGTFAGLNELAAGLTTDDLPRIALRADAGPLNALLRLLDQQLRADGHAPVLHVTTDDPAEAHLILEWPGAPVPIDRLEGWLNTAPDPGQPDQTGADILATHGTGAWPERAGDHARIVLPLPIAQDQAGHAGVTYDFALAQRGAASSRLADLTCVVFDTETTGLDPTRDRIVQIAGVRIARGRLTGERFDTLVNPGRPIPPASTKIHGITDDMVKNAPDLTTALTAFQHFTEDTVMIAHNAPFDMGLLRHAAAETGAHFDNRVLDTVLLSAIIWGQAEVHSLDALTERLGITIPPEDRHTAMGDTIATAQAFLNLIPALEAKGFGRFEQAVQEGKKYSRLIQDANIRPDAYPANEKPAP
ncbi:3'-5' exonuclease [Paracoccus sp. (in: a-proteobacteria)]|uniref:3'-5' exonuclease n=1 Tax=Paracoccus sp. TaxID=267 RepID=UPI0026DF20D9|nr:3'-5' exonuclease [Paracoccus sp. (in: a-proteobacteria)]MDO5647442.1 3'-5' exonuclease [Paracoccus sp. (in: a-proteobacteria)]